MTLAFTLFPAPCLSPLLAVAEVPWTLWQYTCWFIPSLVLSYWLLPSVKPGGFTFIMRAGLLLAVFLGVGKASMTWLVLVKLAHMLALVGLTRYRLETWHKANILPDVATKIGHTGYLHTLIGTMVSLYALTQAGNDNDAIINAVAPIGSALLTSIIGWWVSKELHSYCAQKDEAAAAHGSSKLTEDERAAAQANILGEKIAQAVERRQQATQPGQITGPLTTEQIVLISEAVVKLAEQQTRLLVVAETLQQVADVSAQIQERGESILGHLKTLEDIVKMAPEVMRETDRLLAQLKTRETEEFFAAA